MKEQPASGQFVTIRALESVYIPTYQNGRMEMIAAGQIYKHTQIRNGYAYPPGVGGIGLRLDMVEILDK